ncbi:efflux RND transporter periplasmic adaptor subunit [Pseudogracilibacillus auburnensis]|uniref:Multidrug efflux pump subunit AcrA (Membrane-fusion protein) n=1 Tax=Pseudogracilibacillus auburnensis TaxID=1494959 RepID=A0A2V3VXW8_9BACI|nr:efflux RND transporter periplasmic adaptor subunit [Pseudogracilibacillus auburnensis]PXW85548.1 multidrug efflux pump subunit AcrA (membrane-fusion protein) [Pseudogracilibacillus auburnensis]
MSKKIKILIGVGVLAIIIIMAVIYFVKVRATSVEGESPEDMPVLVEKVTEEALDETILVTGQIVPENEQKIYADPENGEIKEFLVKENQKVKKDDTLFRYDEAKIQNDINAAVRARDMAKNNTTSIQNQVNQLAQQIEQMKKDMNNGQSDDEEGVVITNESIRELENERNQLVLEVENAKAEEATAQAEINELDRQRQALTVKSTMSGTVVKVNKNVERTEEGATEPIIHIISDDPYKVIGTMSEFDAVKIKKDQKVIVRPKVYKDREWKGSVESVSEFPTSDGAGDMDLGGESNVTMYPFKVEITDDTKDLRQGFHVSLEVSVGGDKKKLVVPHMALMDDMMMDMGEEDTEIMDDMFGEADVDMVEESPFVYVLVDGILEKRDVEVGNMNDEFAEIKDGVELGELVVISPTPEMHDGMEVASYDEVE